MTSKLCHHRDCFSAGALGLGWGLSTHHVQWYCSDHFVPALSRLTGLLEAAWGRAAVREAAASPR
jgi:hypothetical protein